MATINPYLKFKGNTEEAFNFYKSIFGGEFDKFMRYKDMPQSDEYGGGQMARNEAEKVMHVALPIGKVNTLMATDPLESVGRKLMGENNFSISIDAESRAEAETLFKGLSDGGTITMPLAETPWGAYFGMFSDKFGIDWIVNYESKQNKYTPKADDAGENVSMT